MIKYSINIIKTLEILIFFFFLANIMVPKGIFFPLLLVSSLLLLIKEKNSFPLLLFISSYFNWAPDIYHTSIIIYVYTLFLIVYLVSRKWEMNYFILTITIGFLISIFIGFFNKFSLFYYTAESYFFILLLFFAWYGYNLDKNNLKKVILYIQKSIVIYYPITGIIVIITSFIYKVHEWDIISYEASKVYSISFIPILLFNYNRCKKKQLLLFLLNLSYQILHYSYGYFGSGDAIFIAISIVFIFWFNAKPIYRVVTLGISLVIIISLTNLIISKGSGVGAYKINQIISSYENLIQGKIVTIPPSPRIRVIETMNTFTELNNKPKYWLFGKGIGSSFTDQYYPFKNYNLLDSDLEGGAFPIEEIRSKRFRKGHSFFSYLPLKLGYLNSIVLIIISLYSFILLERKEYYWLKFSILFYFIVLGFGVKNYIFIGLFIGISLNIINKNRINFSNTTKINE